MTARDFAGKDYFLAALNNQQVDWASVQKAIIVKIVGGSFLSLIIFLLAFVVLILWSYFARNAPTYSESELREKNKGFLTGLLLVSAAVGLIFIYYAMVGNRGYVLAIEAAAIVAVAYFIKSKQNLFACYILLAAFMYLLIKYTISIEGTRLIVVALYIAAASTWLISCQLWKTQPLFGDQQSIRTIASEASAATNRVIQDNFGSSRTL
ncbi:MAG TPA: hypothetical protein DCS21_10645, partial [Gammaproteobacteria bacterium]|nr:hypothetical protein [Gammaproteobacteria bacterium]